MAYSGGFGVPLHYPFRMETFPDAEVLAADAFPRTFLQKVPKVTSFSCDHPMSGRCGNAKAQPHSLKVVQLRKAIHAPGSPMGLTEAFGVIVS